MDDIVRARLKDEILKFAIAHKNSFDYCTLVDFPTLKIHPSDSLDFLVIEIAREHPNVLSSHTYTVKSLPKTVYEMTPLTETFFQNGGFLGLYNKEEKELKEQDEILRLQKGNLELSSKLNKQKLKTHYIPIAISVISLLFAAYSLLKPSNNVPQEQYNTKMESIEEDIEQLRIDFKHENDELKDRLYKAEMLIAVYESYS